MDDQQPSGFITHDGILTKAEVEEIRRRFIEAQQAQPIRVIGYPEIDYPQELRDMHQPMPLDHLIEAYEQQLTDDDGSTT